MKRSKEFWILIVGTIAIPIILTIAFIVISFGGMQFVIGALNPALKYNEINETHISFIINEKGQGLYRSWINVGWIPVKTSNPFMPIEISVYNNTLFEELQFKNRYTCNVSKSGFPFPTNLTIFDCKKDLEFNYSKLYEL